MERSDGSLTLNLSLIVRGDTHQEVKKCAIRQLQAAAVNVKNL